MDSLTSLAAHHAKTVTLVRVFPSNANGEGSLGRID